MDFSGGSVLNSGSRGRRRTIRASGASHDVLECCQTASVPHALRISSIARGREGERRMPNPSEPTKFDAAVSEACTRSGAFALLISLVLIFLIPYWIGRPKEVALGQYLSARFNLAVTVDRLEDDPVFQRYKTSSEAAESTSIAKLIGLNVDMSAAQANAPKTTSNPVASQALRDHPVVNTAVKPSPLSTVRRGRLAAPGPPGPVRFAPSPAINLTVKILYTIDELPVIADLMGKLNDSELLALSRQDSNFFDASIVRWISKRNSLVFRNEMAGVCTPKVLEVPHEGRHSPYFVPALDGEALVAPGAAPSPGPHSRASFGVSCYLQSPTLLSQLFRQNRPILGVRSGLNLVKTERR